ncbi:hypothetical protein M0R72_15165 [Candidatus Pacearchaeota archaeon]|jgi:hypothetical protein|nr:hypothetical protein [Candidatus Pacearchaeota archaeon]
MKRRAFLFAGYTFEQEQQLEEARECARIEARDRKNWDRHFNRVIAHYQESIQVQEQTR